MQTSIFKGIIAVILLTLPTLAQNNGYSEDWWLPDVVEIKPDPYDLIIGDNGQPEGSYNWNADQFALIGRAKTTCSGCTSNGRDVVIKDLKLYVNDEEFFIKAMCYSPTPLGIVSMAKSSGQGGGGLCSMRRTPFAANEFKSACYDSDYFDGGFDPNRQPAGPTRGWFTDVWARDFPIIKKLGANAVRIYNSNPATYLYTTEVLSGKQTAISGTIVGPANGKNHVPFMDAAHDFGLMVIYPLIGDENLMKNTEETKYERFLQNQIDEIGNHPALLMFTVGNELNLIGDAQLLQLVNRYIAFSRTYMKTKWGRTVPFTHAIVDNPTSYAELFEKLDVDVFTSNAGYRGLGFSDLWDGSQTPGFPGLGNLSRQYGKPNFIGEIGWEQINGTETANPTNAGWFNKKWKDLIQKGAPEGCIGGAFFEYLDEPYSKDSALQQSMGVVRPRVSTSADAGLFTTIAPGGKTREWPYTSESIPDQQSSANILAWAVLPFLLML